MWIATSKTLETIWIVPQIEVVGVKIKVISSAGTLQSKETFFIISSGGILSTSRTIEVAERLSVYFNLAKISSFCANDLAGRDPKEKKSSWTQKFHKLHPQAKTLKQISDVTGIPKPALSAVKRKGMGAYYSSGSRPNQTAESWGLARMYSYILGGPTRKIDHHITEKYNVKFKY